MHKETLLLTSKKKSSWSWLKILTLLSVLIPIAALILIIWTLGGNASYIIRVEGWSLFANHFQPTQGHFGLLPEIWGTVLVVLLALIIAAPVSLAIAILANDFSFGFLGTALRWIIGALGGIPPIIFAIMGSFFFTWFIVPKFTGAGLPYQSLPPFGFLPYDQSCTLLGGIMLAFLIIPFMTPLMDDAIQNVPPTLKEASFSLGANRWHTLKEVTLPGAIPGISSAVTLGALTAMGDAIIVAYTIGYQYQYLPKPLFDVLERVAPLTSSVIGLVGGLAGVPSTPLEISASNFVGLLLLITAFTILGLTTFLERRLKQRFIK